jgi:septation ring formation regulator EzrA
MNIELLIPIFTSIITGVLTLIGVLASNSKKQAVTDTKLEDLTREVREHNNFAKRMPVVEQSLKNLEEKVNYFHKV